MATRLIKVKGDYLFYENYSEAEISLLGTLTGDSGTAGRLKVKGIYLYYVDYDGDERRLLGWLTGNTGTAGRFKIKGNFIRYIDYNGDEREIRYLLDKLWHSTTLAHLRNTNQTYSGAHNAALADYMFGVYYWNGLCSPIMGQTHSSGNNVYRIYRAIIAFDTSSIPDDAVIIEAYLSFRVQIARTGGDFDLVIVRGDFDIPPVRANYGHLLDETTPMGSVVNTAGLGDSAIIYHRLNEAGRSQISKTGYTKFAVRTSMDINSTIQPTNTNSYASWGISFLNPYFKMLFVQYEPPV